MILEYPFKNLIFVEKILSPKKICFFRKDLLVLKFTTSSENEKQIEYLLTLGGVASVLMTVGTNFELV